jgi:hypothetical protein
MKKLFITFLAVLHLGVSSGATLHFQYCMGRLLKVELGHDDSDECDKCGMKRVAKPTKQCCTDKHHELKTEKGRLVQQVHSEQQMLSTLPVTRPVWLSSPRFVVSAIHQPSSQAPPSSKPIPVFLRNCIFRI